MKSTVIDTRHSKWYKYPTEKMKFSIHSKQEMFQSDHQTLFSLYEAPFPDYPRMQWSRENYEHNHRRARYSRNAEELSRREIFSKNSHGNAHRDWIGSVVAKSHPAALFCNIIRKCKRIDPHPSFSPFLFRAPSLATPLVLVHRSLVESRLRTLTIQSLNHNNSSR